MLGFGLLFFGMNMMSHELKSLAKLPEFVRVFSVFDCAPSAAGYLPLGSYPVTQITKEKYNGYDWVVFEYNGGQYWTALIGDRNRLERDDTTNDCSRQLAEANAKIAAAKAALE